MLLAPPLLTILDRRVSLRQFRGEEAVIEEWPAFPPVLYTNCCIERTKTPIHWPVLCPRITFSEDEGSRFRRFFFFIFPVVSSRSLFFARIPNG